MKSVLITGAAGFIGSHLCDKCIDLGYRVIAVDNFLTGSFDNISHLIDHPDFEFIEKDICEATFTPEKADWIFHFASPASPKDYLNMPLQTMRVGSEGTMRMLEFAKQVGARILLASTSEVYGDPLEHPQSEQYWGNVNPIGPRGVYDVAKRYQEALSMVYFNKYNVDIRIARIFNTFGPRMRRNDGRAIPSFFANAMNQEDIIVFGDGKQTRSFCYIDDQIEGLFRLMNCSYNLPINIGSDVEITILQLAREIVQMTRSTSAIKFGPLPENDPRKRRPDLSLVRKLLNWEPKTAREYGLKRTYEYYRNKRR